MWGFLSGGIRCVVLGMILLYGCGGNGNGRGRGRVGIKRRMMRRGRARWDVDGGGLSGDRVDGWGPDKGGRLGMDIMHA